MITDKEKVLHQYICEAFRGLASRLTESAVNYADVVKIGITAYEFAQKEIKEEKDSVKKPPKILLKDIDLVANTDNISDKYLKVAKVFHNECLKVYGNKNKTLNNADAAKWADAVKKMIEIDKRTYKEIEEVVNYIYLGENNFWRTTIMSTEGLRKHFDKILIKTRL